MIIVTSISFWELGIWVEDMEDIGVTLRIKYTTLVSSSCAVCRTQRYQDYKYTYFIVYTPLHIIMFTYLCSLYHLHVSRSLCNALCARLQLASFIDRSALHCMVGSICCNRDLNISTVKLSSGILY